MELHLFRHGETNWNVEGRAQSHLGSSLTDLGIQQAKQLSKKIMHIPYERIYSSSSLRTRQTSEYIWPNRKKDIIYLDDLREIILGPWEGRLYKDIAKEDPESHKHFFKEPHLFSVDGAETFDELTKRSLGCLNKILLENERKLVALVGHGAFLKALITCLEGKSLSQIWEPPFMYNCAQNILKFKTDKSIQIILYAGEER